MELIKEGSDFLRHPLMTELVSPEPSINEEAVQLMKFHGSYMQVRPRHAGTLFMCLTT